MNLNVLRHKLEQIKAEWDGNEPGQAEDRARAALEAMQKVDELEALIAELRI